MSEEIELKPCPFCGLEEGQCYSGWRGDMWVLCRGCRTEGPQARNEIDARHKWNIRVDQEAETMRMRIVQLERWIEVHNSCDCQKPDIKGPDNAS